MVGSLLQGLNHGEGRILNGCISHVQIITDTESGFGAAQVGGIQLAAVQLPHGFFVVERIVPPSITGLDVQVRSIVQHQKRLTELGGGAIMFRLPHLDDLHFRHSLHQVLYCFLHLGIVTEVGDLLNGLKVNGFAGQDGECPLIVAAVFQLKADSFDTIHPLGRNGLVEPNRILQGEIVMVFAHRRKLHALRYIITDGRFLRFLDLCRHITFRHQLIQTVQKCGCLGSPFSRLILGNVLKPFSHALCATVLQRSCQFPECSLPVIHRIPILIRVIVKSKLVDVSGQPLNRV